MRCADLWAELETLFNFGRGMPWTTALPQVWAGPLALVLVAGHHRLCRAGGTTWKGTRNLAFHVKRIGYHGCFCSNKHVSEQYPAHTKMISRVKMILCA